MNKPLLNVKALSHCASLIKPVKCSLVLINVNRTTANLRNLWKSGNGFCTSVHHNKKNLVFFSFMNCLCHAVFYHTHNKFPNHNIRLNYKSQAGERAVYMKSSDAMPKATSDKNEMILTECSRHILHVY